MYLGSKPVLCTALYIYLGDDIIWQALINDEEIYEFVLNGIVLIK